MDRAPWSVGCIDRRPRRRSTVLHAISIIAADNPFAFLCGVIALLPVARYANAEWLCWYRNRRYAVAMPAFVEYLGSLGLQTTAGKAKPAWIRLREHEANRAKR